ncbi:hypothetical protein [Myroides odoratus]|uniref:Uncharacterized protein n=1 Tax=Myroides odoratus TaxID=256 RepID=A0A9Q6Z919_MYROD|nr:hypothetical protein [Myroides odoratus]EHQ41528.1 hypothetical protein Myrod_0692 [Myroides odoratus DSM 2801]EKB02679.1 hypothetical protein HMPREF9716_03708 [Myroides odoratus CIP 103059]QQT98949.1 hypothetical protein I6I88_12075 [Myroides odoratus]WQD58864.1 hypothetical protein U0010_06900 [Myroides odoratus]STZ28791.1 Uncharacterised protein [Myroides odoratus]
MSTTVIFNREMKKYLSSDNTEIIKLLNSRFRESNSKTYNAFFDSFLFDYGIISFNSAPLLHKNKYIPYLNCEENNIFDEKKGITDLSDKAHTLTECEKIFANYFISKFVKLSPERILKFDYNNKVV